MKKIGRQVLFLDTKDKNPRNGEGAFIRLNDGAIMFVYTQYYGDEAGDHSTARLSATYSYDEGESWSNPRLLLAKEESALNVMSVSLLRLDNGEIGMLYMENGMIDNNVVCMPIFRYSSDEGNTWSDAIYCTREYGFYVVNNDRVIKLQNGRIIAPTARHGGNRLLQDAGEILFLYSDDNGRSWNTHTTKIYSPYADETQLQEPGLFMLPDGRLWAYFRTAYGHQYQSFSSDTGETWSTPVPNFYFTAPDSPMLVKQVKDYTLAIFNPIGYSCVNEGVELWRSPKRSPFVCAISKDGGLSFDSTNKSFRDGAFDDFTNNCLYLEDDLSNSYCYPAVIETKDGFLVAYYHSNGSPLCLNCTKIIKVTWCELEKALS